MKGLYRYRCRRDPGKLHNNYSRTAATPKKALRLCQAVEMSEDEELSFVLLKISARCGKTYLLRAPAHEATTNYIENADVGTLTYIRKAT